MNVLRILFCILACAFAAASVVIGTLFDFYWFLICIAAAGVCAILMFFCKRKEDPLPPEHADFMDEDDDKKE